ncbi:MAG: hypothetical protein ACR2QC_07755 [Gammaproteobacteria bacterium]
MPAAYKETQFRDRLTKTIGGPMWSKIETGLSTTGVPDLYGIDHGVSIWIECKIVAGRRLRHPLRPLQAFWHREYWLSGGRSLVVASERHNGGPRLGPPVDRIHIWTPGHLAENGSIPLDNIDVGSFDAPFDWPLIKKKLFEA